MVLCDDQGTFCFAAFLGLHEPNEPEEIELLAISRVLQLYVSMGISKILVKSDCLLIIKLCNEERPKNSRFGVLVSKLRIFKVASQSAFYNICKKRT